MKIKHIKRDVLNSVLFFTLCIVPLSGLSNTNRSWDNKILSNEEIERIHGLSRIYGYVRYFYPNENLKSLDWFKFLIYSISQIEQSKSDEDYNQILYKLFSPIYPQIRINELGNLSLNKMDISHSFYILENKNESSGIVSIIRHVSEFRSFYPSPDSIYEYKINSKLIVGFPIAVPSLPLKSKELTSLISKTNRIKLKLFSKSLLGTLVSGGSELSFIKSYEARLANEIMRYNIVQHFYPFYFEDQLNESWEISYKEYYNKIANCKNLKEYYGHVCNLLSLLKDSHADPNFSVSMGLAATYASSYYPEIETVLHGNKLYVKNVGESNRQKIQAGDIITSINNESVDDVVANKLKYISYSRKETGLKKIFASKLFESYKKDSIITLALVNNRFENQSVSLTTNLANPYHLDTVFIKHYNDSIFYINLCCINGKYETIKERISEINNNKGIIFDLRGYAQPYALSIIANIIDTTVSLGNLKQPVTYYPDHLRESYISAEKWHIAPSNSNKSDEYAKLYQYQPPVNIKLKGPYVFLMDASSISFTETLLDIVKAYKLGPIIGENSAGCNGDLMFTKLPIASFTMTGWKFINRDNTQHHSVGIIPDKFVTNSSLVDLQLDTAIKYLLK